MKYDLYRKQTPGITLVHGGSKEDRDLFASYFKVNHPDISSSFHPVLENVKKPLFGHYRSVFDILLKQTAKEGSPIDKVLLMYECDKMGVEHLINRSPRAMSGGQKRRFSVMLEAICGKRKFFLRDETGAFLVPAVCSEIITWLKDYAERTPSPQPLSIVWLTDADIHAPMGEDNPAIPLSFANECFVIREGQIEPDSCI